MEESVRLKLTVFVVSCCVIGKPQIEGPAEAHFWAIGSEPDLSAVAETSSYVSGIIQHAMYGYIAVPVAAHSTKSQADRPQNRVPRSEYALATPY